MSYNGSGTFVINSTGQPVVSGTVISSTAFNSLTADLATGLSTAITTDGQSATTARIPFAAGIDSSLTTDATSIATGSVITAGGVGIAKALWVGGLANIAGVLTTIAQTITSASANAFAVGRVGTTNPAFNIDASTALSATGINIKAAAAAGVPINSQSAANTTVLGDQGKKILHPTTDNNTRTFTIDSNANVAYPVGTTLTFVNMMNTVTIAITSDTMTLANTATIGSRTLAVNGVATAIKLTSTTWLISGVGLT
jgi:hypothetical protein